MTLIKSIAGIRGTLGGNVGENLTPFDVVRFSSAFGAFLSEQGGNKRIVLGRDARPSGALIAPLVSSTLQAMGFDVVDLGLSTTPTVELAVVGEAAAGGIVVTASHNPAEWNALKLLNANGEFLSAAEGQAVLAHAGGAALAFAPYGATGSLIPKLGSIDEHVRAVLSLPLVDEEAVRKKKYKVLVDGVNSTGGIAIPKLLRKMGVEVTELFCTPTGDFPHNPEPLPEHLGVLCDRMKKGAFDLGIAVDPDVDRLVFVSEDGTPFGEEYTLVAVADYVLKNTAAEKRITVSNLSSTQALEVITTQAGGTYYPAMVGEVNVVEKMKACGAVIGGEGNGGVIYPALHYGRDALVGTALFLTYLASLGGTVSALRASYPSFHISKNRMELSPDLPVDELLKGFIEKNKGRRMDTSDGIKIWYDREWVQLRKSNTEPIIRIFAESDTAERAEALAERIMEELKVVR